MFYENHKDVTVQVEFEIWVENATLQPSSSKRVKIIEWLPPRKFLLIL